MIVGFCGASGSGKTEAASLLVPHGFALVGVADMIKRICREVFDFSEDQLWGSNAKRNAPDKRYLRPTAEYLTPRYALQQLGTNWARDCYQDVWIDYTIRLAEALTTSSLQLYYNATEGLRPARAGELLQEHVVIHDIRFGNEVTKLRSAGARVFRIVRPEAGLSDSASEHPSEVEAQAMPDALFDGVIYNNKSLQHLYRCVWAAVFPEYHS